MKYFEDFPTISYPYVGKIAGGSDYKLTLIDSLDIMIRFRIKDKVLSNPLLYYVYEWKDGDRPDTVARNYYGNADLAWLVMMSASRFDALYDFPLPSKQFNDYIISKYGSIEDAISLTHHFEDGEGYVIDYDTYTASTDPGKVAVSCYKYEDDANEAKRRVPLISRKFLPDILKERDQMLKSIKESREIGMVSQVLVK